MVRTRWLCCGANLTGLATLVEGLRAELPVVNDPEARSCIFLTEYRDPVDGQCLEVDGGKAAPQHRQDGFAPLGVEPPRQRHVEAEVFHDIGIPPAIELFALPRRQLGGISSRMILRRERCAE